MDIQTRDIQSVCIVLDRVKMHGVWYLQVVRNTDNKDVWITEKRAKRHLTVNTMYVPIRVSPKIRHGRCGPPGRMITYRGYAPEFEKVEYWPDRLIRIINQNN